MEERKINFFMRIKYAIFNLEKYQDFAMENTKTSVKYFLKLILAFTLIVCTALTYRLGNTINEVFDVIRNNVPDFTFENNELISKENEPTIIEKQADNLNYIVIIDTNIDKMEEKYNEYTAKISNYNFSIIFLKDEIVFNANNMTRNFKYETLAAQYNITSFDKQTVINRINEINITSGYVALYLTIVIYLFCSYLISTLFETLLLFILGFLTARIVGLRLRNSQIYNLGIYALTLPIILNAIYIPINVLTGFEIKYFQLMYTAISYIYLITSILMIRSNLIKQQVEIGKLEEVQKEIKKEIEEREEQEKKETEEKEKNKEEKKKEKNNNSGDEAPEGTV